MQDKFPPELFLRFNLKVEFSPLSNKDKEAFVSKYITSVAEKHRSRIDETLEKTDALAEQALQEIDATNEENIRVLKNKARSWFTSYIAKRNKVDSQQR